MSTQSKQEFLTLYEVIRIVETIPVFLEDHLDRLYHSAKLTGTDHLMPDFSPMKGIIKNYISTQNKNTGNIKLSFSFNSTSDTPHSELTFIPHYYPTQSEYSEGVKVGLLNADRPVPHAKIRHSDIRERADDSIKNEGLSEVLLVDSEGNITEGSRSNVFFIKNDILYSAPEEKVLQGITRIKVVQLCHEAGIRITETTIPATNLNQYEAAFLTGTSIKVLPIRSVGAQIFRTDLPLLVTLQDLYNLAIDNYLRENLQ